MWGFLLGAAAGYVLGTRSGRERYEQIVGTARRVADNPKVQGVASQAKTRATEAVSSARSRGGDRSTTVTAGTGTVPTPSTTTGTYSGTTTTTTPASTTIPATGAAPTSPISPLDDPITPTVTPTTRPQI